MCSLVAVTTRSPVVMQILLVLCLLATPSVLGQVSDDCMYFYREQPRPEPNCNPYQGDLRLRCVALGPLEPAFSIEWYRQDLAGVVMLSGAREREVFISSDPPLRQLSSDLVIAPEDVIPAQYWCQIRVNGQLLQPSTVITILPDAVYNGMNLPACSRSNDQSVFEEPPICADLNQATSEPPPSQPTSPVTTTMGSSTSSPFSPPHSSPPGPFVTRTPTPTVPPTDEEDQSGASFEVVLYAVIAVTAVMAVLIVVLSVAVAVVVQRRRKMKGSASFIHHPRQQQQPLSVGHNHPPSAVGMAEYEDPDSINPVYYNLVPEKREEEREGEREGEGEGGYQSLNPETVDYISLYVTSDIRRKGPPLVEVGGKEYCIVDKTKLDHPTLYDTAGSH